MTAPDELLADSGRRVSHPKKVPTRRFHAVVVLEAIDNAEYRSDGPGDDAAYHRLPHQEVEQCIVRC